MVSVCYSCGEFKASPYHVCPKCTCKPSSDDELALAIMLTDDVLNKEQLFIASDMLRKGQKVELPPDLKKAILAALASAKNNKEKRDGRFFGKLIIFSVLIIAGICYAFFSPWVQFKIASHKDDMKSYETFLKEYPNSEKYCKLSKERISDLQDTLLWEKIFKSRKITDFRDYLRIFPNGKFRSLAKNEIVRLADAEWNRISKTKSIDEIRYFLENYKESREISKAKESLAVLQEERRRGLREEKFWRNQKNSGRIEDFREYLRLYPNGRFRDLAKNEMVRLADSQWKKISKTRSEVEIRYFLENFRESSRVSDANKRLQELYEDFSWVLEQDRIDDYKRFLERFPNHESKKFIDSRIIELEIIEIAAGDYGEMPRATPVNYGGNIVKLKIENKTGYELTLRYSGTSVLKIVIPIGGAKIINLRPGNYRVAASVNSINVKNYYGIDSMVGGQYSSEFYIETRVQ